MLVLCRRRISWTNWKSFEYCSCFGLIFSVYSNGLSTVNDWVCFKSPSLSAYFSWARVITTHWKVGFYSMKICRRRTRWDVWWMNWWHELTNFFNPIQVCALCIGIILLFCFLNTLYKGVCTAVSSLCNHILCTSRFQMRFLWLCALYICLICCMTVL